MIGLANRSADDAIASKRRQDMGWRLIPFWIILAVVAVSTIYPVLFVAFTAFKTEAEYITNKLLPPAQLTMENFRSIFASTNLGELIRNSFAIVSVTVLFVVVVATLAAYALTRLGMSRRAAAIGLVAVVAMMMMPKAVLMVPVFRMVRILGSVNTYHGIIVVLLAMQLPISIYMMSAYFRNVPTELLEAAYVDGASEIRTFRQVALPLVRPGILALATLNFLWLWNELLFSLLLLSDPGKRTLMVGLAALRGQHTITIVTLSAGLLLGMLPPLILYLLLQRHITSGMTQGAIK